MLTILSRSDGDFEARERAGLSQRQLSFPGCSPAYISRIEAGDRIPSLQLLRKMGQRLGVSEDYLATGKERHDEHRDSSKQRSHFDSTTVSWPGSGTKPP